MKIVWVVADNTILDHDIDIEQLKSIGSIWGSYQTWRGCGTDNAICSDISQARSLLQREFQKHCNFYVPEDAYVDLDRPANVKLFGGKFTFEIDHPDELIAMQLAASQADIVLLLGFDWQPKPKQENRLEEHRSQNYRTGVKHAIKDNPTIQWVLINHSETLIDELKGLDNLSLDTLPNVLSMLGS
jgi:hypothetical protein